MLVKVFKIIGLIIAEFIPFLLNDINEAKGKKWYEVIWFVVKALVPFVSSTLLPQIKQIWNGSAVDKTKTAK